MEARESVVPVGWVQWVLWGADRQRELTYLGIDVPAAHGAVTTRFGKAQGLMHKLTNRMRSERYVALFDCLPVPARPPSSNDLVGGIVSQGFFRAIPVPESVGMDRRFFRLEKNVGTSPPCFRSAADIDLRHARTSHQAGAQVNQHQPFVHTLSKV